MSQGPALALLANSPSVRQTSAEWINVFHHDRIDYVNGEPHLGHA